MKKIIKINGAVMGTVNLRDTDHFQIQLNNRTQVIKSKKLYNRNRDKAMMRRLEF